MSGVRFLTIHMRAALQAEIQYRGNFIAQALDAGIGLAVGLGSVGLLFHNVDQLNGWTASHMVTVVGFYTIISGVLGLVIHPSLTRFIREVMSGEFDAVLLKPMDAQLVTGLMQIRVWKVIDIILGCAVVAYSMIAGDFGGDAVSFALVLFMLAVGICAMTALWFIVATSVFWLISVSNILVILQSCFQAARWPSDIYPRAMRIFFTFLLPVTFSTTVPAEYAIGRGAVGDGIGAVLTCVVLCVASRFLWKRGLRRYSSASS